MPGPSAHRRSATLWTCPIVSNWKRRAAAKPRTTPSRVAHQVVLDLMPHDDATFTMEPPGYHLHLWAPETGTITHTAFIGSFSGPHPFLLDPDYPAFGDKESAPATHKV